MRTNAINVLLVDDHMMVLKGVQMMLETARDIRVVAQACCAEEAMAELAIRPVDVALIDISLPGESGMSLLQRMKRVHPKVAAIILTGYSEDVYALRALKSGAHGYITKGCSIDVMLDAVRGAAQGRRSFSATLNETLVRQYQSGDLHKPSDLSPREYEVMMKLVAGESNNAIAAQLNRSPKTVSAHRARLFEKLHVSSVAQLTQYAMAAGLLNASATDKPNTAKSKNDN